MVKWPRGEGNAMWGKAYQRAGKAKTEVLKAGLKRLILSESRAMVRLADMETTLVGRKFSPCKPEKNDDLLHARKMSREDSLCFLCHHSSPDFSNVQVMIRLLDPYIQ